MQSCMMAMSPRRPLSFQIRWGSEMKRLCRKRSVLTHDQIQENLARKFQSGKLLQSTSTREKVPVRLSTVNDTSLILQGDSRRWVAIQIRQRQRRQTRLWTRLRPEALWILLRSTMVHADWVGQDWCSRSKNQHQWVAQNFSTEICVNSLTIRWSETAY